ncbi:unnamed protein product [Schistosoma mattheei]|uniref:Uncharacterized protein n=1 Tax=Schistosoma mattheei TaxID=31246 RepID=A0A183PLH1_9TREM|nr:unnamed protein product [Schistosoma mattheei]
MGRILSRPAPLNPLDIEAACTDLPITDNTGPLSLKISGVNLSRHAALPRFRFPLTFSTSQRVGGPTLTCHSGRLEIVGNRSVDEGQLN